MDLEFTPEQDDLRAQVRAVLARECPISLVREIVEKGWSTGELWSQMVELDWPALTVDEADGGLGGSFLDLAVVIEELGRVIAPGPFLPTMTQFVPVVRELGTEAQRRELLHAVAEGSRTGSLAVAEAGRGWGLDDVTAQAQPDGDSWILSGTKQFVIEGASVDDLAVVCQPRGEHGLAVFVVSASEVTTTALRSLDASRQLATVVLDGVRVGTDRRLGAPGSDATPGLERAMQEAAIAMSLEMVGTCQTIFDLALQYAKDRYQFGVPIGSFQAMKHKFANMLVALERARAACYFAAATVAEEDDRRALATAMAKAAAGDCQQLLAQEGIQSLGGIGYTWEHDMHLYVKRVKSGEPLFGAAGVHRARVAELVGL